MSRNWRLNVRVKWLWSKNPACSAICAMLSPESRRHPVTPDRTTFAGIGTMARTLAYCASEPAPHFIFDVQLGGVRVQDNSSAG